MLPNISSQLVTFVTLDIVEVIKNKLTFDWTAERAIIAGNDPVLLLYLVEFAVLMRFPQLSPLLVIRVMCKKCYFDETLGNIVIFTGQIQLILTHQPSSVVSFVIQ